MKLFYSQRSKYLCISILCNQTCQRDVPTFKIVQIIYVSYKRHQGFANAGQQLSGKFF